MTESGSRGFNTVTEILIETAINSHARPQIVYTLRQN